MTDEEANNATTEEPAEDTTTEQPAETTTTTTAEPPKSPVSMKRTDSGRVETDIGKYHLEVEAKQVPLVGLFFASFIFMISAISQKNYLDSWYGYALSVGIVGMFLALVGLVALKFASEIPQHYMAWFILLWSVLGACLMTFGEGKFTVTGNGYFSVWAMAIFSVQNCGVTGDDIRKQVHSTSSIAGLGIASVIMIIAIAYEVGIKNHRGNAIYTLILSCLTIVFVGAIMYMQRKTEAPMPALYQFGVLSVFAIMWIVAACLVTFNGPFTVTGNGYFTAWVSAVLSVFAALSAKQKWHQESSVV